MNTFENTETELGVVAQHPDYRSEILAIIRGNLAPKTLREKLDDYHENDIAETMAMMTRDERRRLYAVMDTSALASVLEYAEERNAYIGELAIRKKMDVLAEFDASIAAEYLRELEKGERKTLFDLMPTELRERISLLSSFDEDEIGSKMITNFVVVHAGISIKAAMQSLVDQAAEHDNIATLYVVDEEGTWVGAIELKDLIIAREGTDLDSITMTTYPYVYANEQIEDCIERIKAYSEDSIPVLDAENKIVGVLISQDVTQLVDDEMGDDYAKLAGLSSEEDLNEPLIRSIGKRLPWLVVLLGLGLLVSTVVGAFETVVAHLTLIVSFQSLILDMAGNVGTQSLAVTIRVLMDEQLSGKQKLTLVGKEVRVGLANGLTLGSLSFLLIGLYIMLFKGQTPLFAFSVSMCTGISLLIAIVLSSFTGTVVPIIFKKLKVDPAVASGPLITTINDLVAVVTYYGLSWMLLIQVLHL